MKPAITAAFIGTLMGQNREGLNSGGIANTPRFAPDKPPSFAGRVGGLQYQVGMGNSDFGDNDKKPFDISKFFKFDPKTLISNKEKFSAKQLQSMVNEGDFEGVNNAYKKGGANPDLKFDIKDKNGKVVSSGNNMAHILANELNNKEGLESRIMHLFSAMREYATSGGNLSEPNSAGETPTAIIEKSGGDDKGRDYRLELKGDIERYKSEQMGMFYADDKGYVFSGPQKYASFSSPTEQMLNFVYQSGDKISEKGKQRISNLIESGADFDTKIGKIFEGTKGEEAVKDRDSTLADIAVQNWGSKMAKQAFEMAGAVKKIDDFVEKNIGEDFDSLKKPVNLMKASKGRQEEELNRLLTTRELSGLYKQFDESAEQFKGGDKSKGLGK